MDACPQRRQEIPEPDAGMAAAVAPTRGFGTRAASRAMKSGASAPYAIAKCWVTVRAGLPPAAKLRSDSVTVPAKSISRTVEARVP